MKRRNESELVFDRAIAIGVMGWVVDPTITDENGEPTLRSPGGGFWVHKNSVSIPRYSSSIEEAWKVVEKLSQSYIVSVFGPDEAGGAWCVEVMTQDQKHVLATEVAKTAPIAICLAGAAVFGVSVKTAAAA